MRNPLKRLARPDQPKRPLRERLAGAKTKLVAVHEKYGRTLRVHRALNAPLPTPAPAIHRAALVNYATFLAWERDRVCAELYPHLGVKAARFVIGLNAADQFFYPNGRLSDGGDGGRDVPPASARALKVLDLVGIDWTSDANENSRRHFEACETRVDNGQRPAVPFGWPEADAALTEALDDLQRLDAAQEAMHSGAPRRNADTVPGYGDLEDARDNALDCLQTSRATTLPGLQAKAHALLTKSVVDGGGLVFEGIAKSLARDVVGAQADVLDQHRPDPILTAIEETKHLAAVYASACHAEPEAEVAVTAAGRAMFEHWQNVTLKTVPSTGAGVTALARYAIAFHREQGEPQDGEFEAILSAIARSPLRA